MVTGLGRGLGILITSEILFLIAVLKSNVPMIPGGVDLKLT